MKKEPRGRLFQDREFEFAEFNGLKIERLIVCENPETSEPILVYIKMENKNWHQYFLDAGIGFWENWDEIEIDDDSYNFIELTNTLKLKAKRIIKISCQPELNNSRITLELENNENLVLKCIRPEIFDSGCELIMMK
jgi:hypothetical protein